MLTQLLIWLNTGMDNSILVYDDDSKKRELTKKLILLMKHISIKDFEEPITKLYIDEDDHLKILNWNFNPTDHVEINNVSKTNPYKIFIAGIEICPVKELQDEWVRHKYIKNNILYVYHGLGGYLAYDDEKIVIGVTKNHNNVLLGSY